MSEEDIDFPMDGSFIIDSKPLIKLKQKEFTLKKTIELSSPDIKYHDFRKDSSK